MNTNNNNPAPVLIKRCYSHNFPMAACPTRVRCTYRGLVSGLAWALLRSIGPKPKGGR
jgi:hypothetical protein